MCLHASKTGFNNLSVHRCQALFKLLQAPHKGPLPRREADIVVALIKFVEPNVSQQEIEERLELRNKKVSAAEQPSTILMDEDAMKLAEFVIDGHEFSTKYQELVEKAVAKAAASRTSRAASSSGASASKTATSSSTDKAHRPIRPEGSGTMREAEARAFAPPGCNLHEESKWCMRWRLTMPHKDAPPYSHSRSFKDDDGSHAAMLAVLRWGWEHHTAMTGQKCPYDLRDPA